MTPSATARGQGIGGRRSRHRPPESQTLELLDAAITVLGSGGIRALTYRAVDAAAGLPAGSASNVFRSRDALLEGVADRIVEREFAKATGPVMAAGIRRANQKDLANLKRILEEPAAPRLPGRSV